MTRALALLLTIPVSAVGQPPSVDTGAVVRAFEAARLIVARDGGRLWGRSLDGPILVADPVSGSMFASDSAAGLERFGSLFRGRVPQTVTPANTALTWSGRRWTMLRWPPPSDGVALHELVAHELWHRIQDSLGLAPREQANGHLENESARVWLRLEARALRRAVEDRGTGGAALIDALRFRAARYREFPGADTSEAILELNEGLAEYTGIRLSGRTSDLEIARAVRGLGALDSSETVVRSFAYGTGPGYGLLLDRVLPQWRSSVVAKGTLSGLFAAPATDSMVLASAAGRYGAAEIRVEEGRRAERRALRRSGLIARFVTGPRLSLPLRRINIGLDPSRVESLDSLGTVYGGARITDEWGALDAREGEVRVGGQWTEATVPVPRGYAGELEAPRWKLDLKPGWRVVRAAGDLWRVERLP